MNEINNLVLYAFVLFGDLVDLELSSNYTNTNTIWHLFQTKMRV